MKRKPRAAEQILDSDEPSVLDLLDHVLNKGVMATGDLTLGVAGIDLVYVRLSALLCAADRVLPPDPGKPRAKKRTHHVRRRFLD
ncbi:MAG TPA: gas vesicle protein [Vicinamibacterales bacterium]|jgi:hypothetical protein|nr:gas vesicle protein [Vicinamibacterales bacterium]